MPAPEVRVFPNKIIIGRLHLVHSYVRVSIIGVSFRNISHTTVKKCTELRIKMVLIRQK